MRAIRNVAIIAHVDHGKTTLVDKLLRQSGTFAAHQHIEERVMDSNDLERERGITILAKNCAVTYEGTHINIVDTPGHADFGGEVERVLSMVDGVLLLVDAVEGPMPQTRFVTRKALALGLKPIVVVNKVDRPGARPDWVVNHTFDLFDKLGATEAQLDFPIIYASALEGWATEDLATKNDNLKPLFEAILKHVPARDDDPTGPLQLQICSLDYSSYVGRIGIGRVDPRPHQVGPARDRAARPRRRPDRADQRQSKPGPGIQGSRARGRRRSAKPATSSLINGIEEIGIGVTIADPEHPEALPLLKVDEPTLTMNFQVNTSPLAGREGKYVTSRQLRERLQRELMSNVALRVEETGDADVFEVSGRGELHLTILLENMRREGYELAVVAAARRDQGDRRREAGAVRNADGRRRGNQPGRGDGSARRAARRSAGHAVRRQRPRAAGLPHTRARADRLPVGIHDHDARHRHHEPRVRRLRPDETRHGRAPQRRADFGRIRRSRRLRALEAAGTRPHVREPRRSRSTKASSSASTAATTISSSTRSRASSSPTSAPRAPTKRCASRRRSRSRSNPRSNSSPTTSWSRSRRSRSASASAISRNRTASERHAPQRSFAPPFAHS